MLAAGAVYFKCKILAISKYLLKCIEDNKLSPLEMLTFPPKCLL